MDAFRYYAVRVDVAAPFLLLVWALTLYTAVGVGAELIHCS